MSLLHGFYEKLSKTTTGGERAEKLIYSKKFCEHWNAKKQVAAAAAQLMQKLELTALTVPEGSSASAIYEEYVTKRNDLRPLTIYTNNCDVLLHRTLGESESYVETLDIRMAPGKVRARSGAILGQQTDDWFSKNIHGLCLLPVSAFHWDQGPCARDPKARNIKRRILELAENLLLVLDSQKMRKNILPFLTHVADRSEWKNWINGRYNRNMWVVTTLSPRIHEHWESSDDPLCAIRQLTLDEDEKKELACLEEIWAILTNRSLLGKKNGKNRAKSKRAHDPTDRLIIAGPHSA